MNTHVVSALAWERMGTAVAKVRERLQRTCETLEQAQIPYAVCGGHAVAAWVATVDEAAVRISPDVEIAVRRANLESVISALTAAGLAHRLASDRANVSQRRDEVRIYLANERSRDQDAFPMRDVSESVVISNMRVLKLTALTSLLLSSFRVVDRVHLRDLIDVELLDASWLDRLPPELAARLKQILDTPEG
jgi:hypothetical protein